MESMKLDMQKVEKLAKKAVEQSVLTQRTAVRQLPSTSTSQR